MRHKTEKTKIIVKGGKILRHKGSVMGTGQSETGE